MVDLFLESMIACTEMKDARKSFSNFFICRRLIDTHFVKVVFLHSKPHKRKMAKFPFVVVFLDSQTNRGQNFYLKVRFESANFFRNVFSPSRSCFEIRCLFPKIASFSADTATNLLRTADVPLSWKFSWELKLTATILQRKTVFPPMSCKKSGSSWELACSCVNVSYKYFLKSTLLW